jgi:hypothetical protein
MGIVLSTHSISLDGFMAQPDGKPGPLHEWLWAGEHPSRHAESDGELPFVHVTEGVERAIGLAREAAGTRTSPSWEET